MFVRRPILVFEYLLANPSAWHSASESMRIEAATMLTAVVQDLERLEDVRPAVLLSPSAANMLRSSGRLASTTEIIVSYVEPAVWLQQPSRAPASFDATFVVAPECGGVLVSLLRLLQSDLWRSTCSLNVPWAMAEVFSDKYWTFQWLERQRIRTPETKTLSDARADELGSQSAFKPEDNEYEALPRSSRLGIIKPRDGAGCQGICFVPMRLARFQRQPQTCFSDDRWILQRFLSGVSCSVGFIGGGSTLPTQILPPARQNLAFEFGSLHYFGGTIPCGNEFAASVSTIAEQLAASLGSFSGYLGADIVVVRSDDGRPVPYVIEINPRLCTSYAGYRLLSEDNLAAHLLQQSSDQPLLWKPGRVSFTSDGQARYEVP